MKIYVYVDNDNLIKELDLIGLKKTKLTVFEIELNNLPQEEVDQLIALEKKWRDPDAYHENYTLVNKNQNIRKVTWICYNAETLRVNIISPKKDKSENDKVIWGLHEFDETIKKFIEGDLSISLYEVDETSPLLTLVEKPPEVNLIKGSDLLEKYKISFVDEGEDFRMIFHRKNKKLSIIPTKKIQFKMMYLTKKNDRTILYDTIKISSPTEKTEIKKIVLPQNFDLYASLDITCKYMEK